MWNFKGTLWNSTQNILPIHWKVRFLYNIEILRALRLKSSYAFLKRPPVTRKKFPFDYVIMKPLGVPVSVKLVYHNISGIILCMGAASERQQLQCNVISPLDEPIPRMISALQNCTSILAALLVKIQSDLTSLNIFELLILRNSLR